MALLDIFHRPKSETEKLIEEWNEQLFPGGKNELLFKSKTVVQISNGKLTVAEAAKVYSMARTRFQMAAMSFNGRTKLGPKAEDLFTRMKADSGDKLSASEANGIIHYVIFDKIDPSLETHLVIKNFLEGTFGCDSVGCNVDEIPSGIGEFGFDPTNPIPVRGIASNIIYLQQLRTRDGKAVEHERNASLTVPNISGNVDEYEISQKGVSLCKLYISPYNQKICDRPPRGFILVCEDSDVSRSAVQSTFESRIDPVQEFKSGVAYHNTKHRTKEDFDRAFVCFKKSAEANYAPGQYALGCMYGGGHYRGINLEEAFKWYVKAAEQGYADAQFKVGYCYSVGLGVKSNWEEAKKWYRSAAEQGHAEAKKKLSWWGSLYDRW